MHLKKQIVVVYISLAVFSVVYLVRGEVDFSSLITHEAFANDDFCSTAISSHFCVKNILSVLVEHINDNLQEIKNSKLEIRKLKENEQRLKSLEYSYAELLVERKINAEKFEYLQNQLEKQKQEINSFEHKQKDISRQNRKHKTKVNELESIHFSDSYTSTNNFLTSFLQNFGDQYKNAGPSIDNSTLVRKNCFKL